MKIAVIHPTCGKESAELLAHHLKCHVENPFITGRRDFKEYDLVINYGCNRRIIRNAIINKPMSIGRCIDKHTTFSLLRKYGVSIPYFTVDPNEAAQWPTVVVRDTTKGNDGKGMKYVYPNGNVNKIPRAPLYTEYFEHNKEFRIVVFNGITIAAYEKVTRNGEWDFIPRTYRYLDTIKEDCVTAAKALQIHYVGFDVVMNKDMEYVILEANSAPVLTDDSIKAFKSFIRKLK